jgi:hypothetical protein
MFGCSTGFGSCLATGGGGITGLGNTNGFVSGSGLGTTTLFANNLGRTLGGSGL